MIYRYHQKKTKRLLRHRVYYIVALWCLD